MLHGNQNNYSPSIYTPFQVVVLTTCSTFTRPEKSLSLEKARKRVMKPGRKRSQGQYFAKKSKDGICAQTGANAVPVSLRSTKYLSTCLTSKLEQPWGCSVFQGAPRHGGSVWVVLAELLTFTDCTYGRRGLKLHSKWLSKPSDLQRKIDTICF